MEEALPGEAPEDVIRRKCRELVRVAKTYGWSGPPFDPVLLASLNGIIVEETNESFEGDGRIFPRRKQVVIQYRQGSLLERQRFTICHELAHTCFRDVFETVRQHNAASEDDGAHRIFENLCDIGASELLMPHEEFSSDLAAAPVCMEHAHYLHARYLASIDATLKRLLEITPHPCAAVFLTNENFKEFSAVRDSMRVRWMWRSKTFKSFIRPGTLLPKGSCTLSTCSEQCSPFPSVRETWWIDGVPRSWYVEPLRLPFVPSNRDYPKVVALLHSRRPN